MKDTGRNVACRFLMSVHRDAEDEKYELASNMDVA